MIDMIVALVLRILVLFLEMMKMNMHLNKHTKISLLNDNN